MKYYIYWEVDYSEVVSWELYNSTGFNRKEDALNYINFDAEQGYTYQIAEFLADQAPQFLSDKERGGK